MTRTTREPLSGRVQEAPSKLIHDQMLKPQFDYEVRHLLPGYVLIEKVLLTEYHRMGIIDAAQCAVIGGFLQDISPHDLTAAPEENLSDIAFAIERHVESRLAEPVACWHVDRSRNDLQACAQMIFGRDEVTRCAEALLDAARAALSVADRTTEMPMPGHTQLQAAQIITPGFYFAAVATQILHTAARLLSVYDDLNLSPLGAGAMAGQELPWDRQQMARLIGCTTAVPHALVAVASRRWRLETGAELAAFAVTLSRFVTDLMTWGTAEVGFVTLPDSLAGISSAMPQKRNFPVLERLRGRTGHVVAGYVDLLVGQRGVPYTNMIETSKEAGGREPSVFDDTHATLRLFTGVLENLGFRPDRMRDACRREFLGGFTLANLLTLRTGVPWRIAQIIAGQYITSALDRGLRPEQTDPALLDEPAARHGYRLDDPGPLLAEAFDVERGLWNKKTPGSAHPDEVRALLDVQHTELGRLEQVWADRRRVVRSAIEETDRLLGLTD